MTYPPGLSATAIGLPRPAWAGNQGLTRLPPALFGLATALAVPALLLALWWLAADQAWLPAQILPAPRAIVATTVDLVRDGDLGDPLRVSLWRVSLGFVGGATSGLVVGAALGLSPTFDAWVGPTIRGIAQVPTLGWLPFLILLLGLGEPLNLLLIGKAAFVPITISTARAIAAIPPATWEVARVLRLRRRTLLRRMLIPATLPMLFAGLRQSLANAWIALIVVEMLAGDAGIGYLIVWGRTLFQIDVVIAGMIVIGVIGFAMDAGLRAVERRLRRWDGARA